MMDMQVYMQPRTFGTYSTPGDVQATGKLVHTTQLEQKHAPKKIKGPDNPTYQLLPITGKRKVKMGWEMREREKRW